MSSSQLLPVYYHPIYSSGIDPTANFPRERYSLLAGRIRTSSCGQHIDLRIPRRATREEILTVHSVDYTDRFLEGRLRDDEIRRIGLRPWRDAIVDRTLFVTGGSLQAVESALSTGGMAANLAGGTHHADRSAGSGYCIFNDIAICAEAALRRPQVETILVLDLDVHQGDGTASIFAGDDRVLTVSIHAAKNFPSRKAKGDIDVALPTGSGDEEYLDALESTIAQLRPRPFDILLLQAGVDSLAEDRLGLLNLTREGLRRRNAAVFRLADAAAVPVVLFLGGGYADPIDHTITAYEDLLSAAARLLRDRSG